MAGPHPIVTTLSLEDDSCARFMTSPPVQPCDEALTREAEAFLINRFKPAYNEVLFENYPDIAGGMRSKGYSRTELIIEGLPAFLYTDHFSMEPTIE